MNDFRAQGMARWVVWYQGCRRWSGHLNDMVVVLDDRWRIMRDRWRIMRDRWRDINCFLVRFFNDFVGVLSF